MAAILGVFFHRVPGLVSLLLGSHDFLFLGPLFLMVGVYPLVNFFREDNREVKFLNYLMSKNVSFCSSI